MGAGCLRMLIKEGLGNVTQTLTLEQREPAPVPPVGLPKVTPRRGAAARCARGGRRRCAEHTGRVRVEVGSAGSPGTRQGPGAAGALPGAGHQQDLHVSRRRSLLLLCAQPSKARLL